MNLEQKILELKSQLNAIILSHYYQNEEIQDLADFVGDSLDLSRKAASNDAEVIVFCGVKFMAEGAKILSPNKTVLLPDFKAGCSLEESCPPKQFAEFRKKHPDHLALTYINCSAEVKALSDIIVTSSNAKKIIEQIPASQPILFAPDQHLGRYLIKATGRDMLLWPGSCIVHERFSEKELVQLIALHPKAKVIAHPECPENLLRYAHHVGSTSALLKFTEIHQGSEFIVLTERNIIHQMKLVNPSGIFYECATIDQAGCSFCSDCPYMKLNTTEKLYEVMNAYLNKTKSEFGGEIFLNEGLRAQAEKPLRRMLEMS